MNHYEVGKTQGHSKAKVDSMIKKAKKWGAARTKALDSFGKMNAERKRQGHKPKTDRASKGLYDFLDKYE